MFITSSHLVLLIAAGENDDAEWCCRLSPFLDARTMMHQRKRASKSTGMHTSLQVQKESWPKCESVHPARKKNTSADPHTAPAAPITSSTKDDRISVGLERMHDLVASISFLCQKIKKKIAIKQQNILQKR